MILGLHESDRRRLMGLPPLDETSVAQDLPQDEDVVPATDKKDVVDDSAKWVGSSLSRKLTEEEKLAVSQVAKLNGWDEQSATAAYKMYIAKHSEGSPQAFLQLLQQIEPDAYDSHGELDKSSSDDDGERLLHIKV